MLSVINLAVLKSRKKLSNKKKWSRDFVRKSSFFRFQDFEFTINVRKRKTLSSFAKNVYKSSFIENLVHPKLVD